MAKNVDDEAAAKKAGLSEAQHLEVFNGIVEEWLNQDDKQPDTLVTQPYSFDDMRDILPVETLKKLPLAFCVSMGDRTLFFRALAARVGITLSEPINDMDVLTQLRDKRSELNEAIEEIRTWSRSDACKSNNVRTACEMTTSILYILSERFNKVFNVEEYYDVISKMLPDHVQYWSEPPRFLESFKERLLVLHTLVRQGKYLAAAPLISEKDRTSEFFTREPYTFDQILKKVEKAIKREYRSIRRQNLEDLKTQIKDDFAAALRNPEYIDTLKKVVEKKSASVGMTQINRADEHFSNRAVPQDATSADFAKYFGLALEKKLSDPKIKDTDKPIIQRLINKFAAFLFLRGDVRYLDLEILGVFKACHSLLHDRISDLARHGKELSLRSLFFVYPNVLDINNTESVSLYQVVLPAFMQSALQNPEVIKTFLREIYIDSFDDYPPGQLDYLHKQLVYIADNIQEMDARTRGLLAANMARIALIDNNPETVSKALSLFQQHAKILSKAELDDSRQSYFDNYFIYIGELLNLRGNMNEEQQEQLDAAVQSIFPQLATSFGVLIQNRQKLKIEDIVHLLPTVSYLNELSEKSHVELPQLSESEALQQYAGMLLTEDLRKNGSLLSNISNDDFIMLYRACGDADLQTIIALHNIRNLFATSKSAVTLKNHLENLFQQPQAETNLQNFCSRMMQLGGSAILQNLADSQGEEYFKQPRMKPLMREYFKERFKEVLHKLYRAYENSYSAKSGKGASILQRRDATKEAKLKALRRIFRNGEFFSEDPGLDKLRELAQNVCNDDLFQHKSGRFTSKGAKAQIVDDMTSFLNMMEKCEFSVTPDEPYFELESETEAHFKSHGYGSVN